MPLVLNKDKTSTWRLFDDKNLSIGDQIQFKEFGTINVFGHASITRIVVKQFNNLTSADKEGHETFLNDQEMYDTYGEYYGKAVGPETLVKIIWFELQD